MCSFLFLALITLKPIILESFLTFPVWTLNVFFLWVCESHQ